MANEIQVWNKVMSTALDMPGVKVDREKYLRTALGNYCTIAQVNTAVDVSPLSVLSRQDIDRLANIAIGSHVKKVTAISAVSGLPGGFAMAATIPADIAQYYYHVFVLSQKLAYLYGYPDLLDENGNATDDTINLLTLFTGVMMGAAVANNAITNISRQVAVNTAKKLPKQALTKGVIYPIVKKIAKKSGYEMTKDIYAKGVSKFIPVLGGIISGALTLATFRPGAKRLQKQLQENMELFYHNLNMTGDERFVNMGGAEEETDYQYEEVKAAEPKMSIEELKIVVLISLAHIDNSITESERKYINEKIEASDLSDEEKFELVGYLRKGEVPQFDFKPFQGEQAQSVSLLTNAIELLKLDRRFTLGERLYIKKIGKELGFSAEDLEEFMK